MDFRMTKLHVLFWKIEMAFVLFKLQYWSTTSQSFDGKFQILFITLNMLSSELHALIFK